mmetsp:Transcript_14813/g.26125  ORF Transcript_14813/g.26125 Transcript_14813/m.26125 type:complete len:89 (-) Transcript_14813:277-543(-)
MTISNTVPIKMLVISFMRFITAPPASISLNYYRSCLEHYKSPPYFNLNDNPALLTSFPRQNSQHSSPLDCALLMPRFAQKRGKGRGQG